MKKIIYMVVPSFSAKGGITSVVNGYKESNLEAIYDIEYIETYCDGTKWKKLLKAIEAYLYYRSLVRRKHPDLIHVHTSFGASFYRKMPFVNYAAKKKIPVICHVHGSEIDKLYINASRKKKRLIEKTFNKCFLIITLTEENKKKLSVVNTCTKMIVLNNFSSLHQINYDLKEKIVLFLGFITELKGCFDIPEVVREVAKRIPDVQFVLGGVGEETQLREKLKKINVSDRVVFPGWVKGNEKDLLLKKSALFLLPSYTEAMPMSILEAMGYGLPVISTNVGGIPQLVKSGENGYLYEPGDIKGMANGIIKLLENEELSKEMGLCGYNMVLKNFSLEEHIEKLKTIYKMVLKE